MDVNEVPQDAMGYKDKDKIKKLVYAVDEHGNYTGINSAGWEAENVATRQAWEAIEEELKEMEELVRRGEQSPIAYFMLRKLMDISILARYAGKWQWQVRRHMKPAVFKKLNQKMLDKYAEIFEISTAELINFGKSK
ncbi:MAG TPA: hypothetical protein VL098_02835 [Flavipsychrobacter sp.]|nr:hypothetical protein [Flavipsychrobacter sp.]